MKHIYFTVTNDLSYDQRMHRICTSLAENGFKATLVGRKLKTSIPLQQRPFEQKRLRCFFNKRFLFYTEYNFRLFFFLVNKKMDGICAIDLDTILPCLAISKLKRIPRIYDAHEYFTELKEVRTRPFIKKIWTAIERFAIPKYHWGYTVAEGLASVFNNLYSRQYVTIRNLPVLTPLPSGIKREKFIVYQGAVNEGRGFEYLIPAMKKIKYPLVICGDGNFMQQLKVLIAIHKVEHKVEAKGMILPGDLKTLAQKASLGIGLADKEDINQYYALPNKFFDYMHAGLPQVAMNYLEYPKLNNQFRIAVLLNELSAEIVADTINTTIEDESLLTQLSENAMKAREIYCWQKEEKVLLEFYKQIFP